MIITVPDIEASAALLTARIRHHEPTAYFRFGDGFIECVARPPGRIKTCDGEVYTPELAKAMIKTFNQITVAEEVFLGNWARDRESTAYLQEWESLFSSVKCTLIDFEALLIVRESAALVEFYRTVKADCRRKLFMGPASNEGAADMLNAMCLEIPDSNLFDRVGEIEDRLDRTDFDILLFGAGMAGNIPVVNIWKRHPERTYINLGSAMDPLFKGRSRSNQLVPEDAKKLFKDLLQ